MFKKVSLLYTVYYILCTALIGCTTIYNPATGRRERYFINTRDEVAIGRQVAKEVKKQYKVLEDEEIQEHINAIGLKIACVSARQDLHYYFTVLDSKELNAFAIPGGGVYINSGLVNLLDDDEIACVLAHEVGHIAARHQAKKIQGQMGYQLLMAVALFEMGKKDRKLAKQVSQGAGIIFELVLLGYSRQDELLADRLAIKYAHQAGYNPRGMASSLKKLKQHGQDKGGWGPMVVFRSHPYLEDRIRAAEVQIDLMSD